MRRRRRHGMQTVILLCILLVVVLVSWFTAVSKVDTPFLGRPDIPTVIPPAAGAPVPAININAPGRTSDQLEKWAKPLAAKTGIPPAALRAYGNAVVVARHAWPKCHLTWTTLAGYGYVETRHGRYNGDLFHPSSIGPDGVVRPPIVGVPLDGSPGLNTIKDSDNGAMDGDKLHDRAVGPMQFIPESWKRYGMDANGDGKADPNQIDDAALSAAKLLCAHGRDLATKKGWESAAAAYNSSYDYLVKVRDAAAAYALGVPA